MTTPAADAAMNAEIAWVRRQQDVAWWADKSDQTAQWNDDMAAEGIDRNEWLPDERPDWTEL